MFPAALPNVPIQELEANSFKTNGAVTLLNGDTCKIDQWVLVRPDGNAPKIFCIREILQRVGSDNEKRSHPDAILLQKGAVSGFAAPYRMPSVSLEDQWTLLPLEVCCCPADFMRLHRYCLGHSLCSESSTPLPS